MSAVSLGEFTSRYDMGFPPQVVDWADKIGDWLLFWSG